jgi:hypothetical protein
MSMMYPSDSDFVHNDHRASFIPMGAANIGSGAGMPRGDGDSFYADSMSYDNGYRPQTSGTAYSGAGGAGLYHGRNQSSTHLGVVETRQPKRLSGYGGEAPGVGRRESFGSDGQGQALMSTRERNERATRRKSRGAEVAVYDDRSGY